MSNKIKFVVLAGVLGCYVWYLSSLQTVVNQQLSQLKNTYANIDRIAAQSVR